MSYKKLITDEQAQELASSSSRFLELGEHRAYIVHMAVLDILNSTPVSPVLLCELKHYCMENPDVVGDYLMIFQGDYPPKSAEGFWNQLIATLWMKTACKGSTKEEQSEDSV